MVGLRREVYLDWNATTPPHPDVLAAMAEAQTHWANPASVHRPGRAARALVEATRERVAQVLGVESRDVLFTSGGTEANNLALHRASLLVTSRLEHPSVVRVAERLEETGRTRWIEVPADGQLQPEAVAMALDGAPQGTWVSIALANHETGVIQPLSAIADAVRGAGARLHVDAVQALGKHPLDDCRHADAITVCAHKVRGPKGIGALAWRGGAPMPLLTGGAQERGLRPGSQDAVLAAGFGAALEHLDLDEQRALEPLRNRLERELASVAERNGLEAPRLAHISNLSFPGWRSDELVAALDLRGVYVSAGSACSAGTLQPSTVIASMLGIERASQALRISLGALTTVEDVDFALAMLRDVLQPRGRSETSSIG